MKKIKQTISVVIPTYNSYRTLLLCIASLQKQTVKPKEIIVVDNASTDGTTQKVKAKFPQVKIYTMKQNSGVTGGRNKGITKAKGKYILFFDHDMEADEHMIAELIKPLKENKRIGITTPKIYYATNHKMIWSAGTDINLLTGQIIFYGGEDKKQYNKVKEVGVAPAALFVDRKVIDKAGVFDPVYFATYEDTDFCFRAKKYGFSTYYVPTAISYHSIPYDPLISKKRLMQRSYYVARNRIIFMKRYGTHFFLFLFFIPVFFTYYLVTAIEVKNLSAMMGYIKGLIDGLFYFS